MRDVKATTLSQGNDFTLVLSLTHIDVLICCAFLPTSSYAEKSLGLDYCPYVVLLHAFSFWD